MKFLLPYRFKRVGAWIFPLGFGLWFLMQRGYVTQLLIALFGPEDPNREYGPFWVTNVVTASLGFAAFLAGLYFLTFSREKVEDERSRQTRLESFQFAALLQLLTFLGTFGFIAFIAEPLRIGSPSDFGLQLIFIGLIVLFWMGYILRFNYVLHFRRYPGDDQ